MISFLCRCFPHIVTELIEEDHNTRNSEQYRNSYGASECALLEICRRGHFPSYQLLLPKQVDLKVSFCELQREMKEEKEQVVFVGCRGSTASVCVCVPSCLQAATICCVFLFLRNDLWTSTAGQFFFFLLILSNTLLLFPSTLFIR